MTPPLRRMERANCNGDAAAAMPDAKSKFMIESPTYPTRGQGWGPTFSKKFT